MRLAALALLLATAARAETHVLEGMAFDGARRAGLRVVVRDGLIAEVTARPGAAGPVQITPGFLDLDARFGLREGDEEPAEAVAPDLRLADGFAADDAEAAALAASGVTTAWLLGGDAVVVAGAGAIVQPAPGGVAIDRPAWGLASSLSAAARQPERAPTSLPDQARAIRDVAPSAAGPLRVRFDDGASMRLAASLGVPVGMPHGPGLGELRAAPGWIASADWTAVPAGAWPALVAEADAGRLALGSGVSIRGAAAVRLAASRLVEEGASPDAVLAALTSGAAALAGLTDRGRIVVGARADLVAWSGDPLSLGSRAIHVIVAGRTVHHDP